MLSKVVCSPIYTLKGIYKLTFKQLSKQLTTLCLSLMVSNHLSVRITLRLLTAPI